MDGKPVELPHLDLLKVSTPQLASLKKLSNVFKTFSAAVDNEAKRELLIREISLKVMRLPRKAGPEPWSVLETLR